MYIVVGGVRDGAGEIVCDPIYDNFNLCLAKQIEMHFSHSV